MKIENNTRFNSLGFTRREMRFCWITLVLAAVLLGIGWVATW